MDQPSGVDHAEATDPPVAPVPQAETCGATISGSWMIATRAAPAIATDFLSQQGFTTKRRDGETTGEITISGTRGDERCAIVIRASTSAQGFRDLAAGTSHLALSQRPVTLREIDALATASAGDFLGQRNLSEHVIGFDAYGVVVNAANPVQRLSYDLTPAIVMGRITRWSALGGLETPIRLYSVRGGSGAEDFPNDLVPHVNNAWIEAFESMNIIDNEDALVMAIASDPQALALMSTAYAADNPRVRALQMTFRGAPSAPSPVNVLNETYPAARRLFVYTRPQSMQSNAFVRDLIVHFKSERSFAAIEAAGFSALRPGSRLSAVANRLSGCRFGTEEFAALVSATEDAVRLPVTLHFRNGGMELDQKAQADLTHYAASLSQRRIDAQRIMLIGHSDYNGDVTDNRTLALQRANVVRAALEARGVVGVKAESAGEVCPLASNQTPEGRERNRRVEIWVSEDGEGVSAP